MTLPTIHLNGTGAQALLDGYIDAGQAVRAAIDALQAAAPNGRDYYPQGAGVIGWATQEHNERCAKLRAVYAELQALAEHVSDHV